MEKKQINKQKYCPNMFFNNGNVSIGEFKTIEEAMDFPLKETWCINRTHDNKLQAYEKQGTRILIICNWNKGIQDSTKFIVALVFEDGSVKYFDANDIQMNGKQYENSITQDVLSAIDLVADAAYQKSNQIQGEKQTKTNKLSV